MDFCSSPINCPKLGIQRVSEETNQKKDQQQSISCRQKLCIPYFCVCKLCGQAASCRCLESLMYSVCMVAVRSLEHRYRRRQTGFSRFDTRTCQAIGKNSLLVVFCQEFQFLFIVLSSCDSV
uniref:Uncharacterized protein n=1 Tax=Spongospora subterranea TaxID=70186 RepID=A0A0H5QVD8_9EUKA|eukprot:CRZ05864.1 hypothetical protein [Spongospora subterranea]